MLFIFSVFHEIAINLGLVSINVTEFYFQNGYAGKLGLIWISESIDLNLGILALTSVLILSLVRMYQIISPIPLFKGIFEVSKQIVKMSFIKNPHVPSNEIQSSKDFFHFKAEQHFIENETK